MWLCIAALPYQSLLSAGIDSLGKDWRSCVIQGQHGPFILTSWGKMFCLLTCLLTEAVGTDCISLVSVEKPCVLAAVVFSLFRVWHCQSCHCMICPAATTVDLQLLLFCILCVGPRISVQFFMVDGVWRVNSGGEVFTDSTVRILSDSSWIYHKTDPTPVCFLMLPAVSTQCYAALCREALNTCLVCFISQQLGWR